MILLNLNSNRQKIDSVSEAARIFEEHGDFIRAVFRFKAGNRAPVEDLLQDFFLLLVQRPLPSDVRDTRSYLYKAISNSVFDAIRRIKKYKQKCDRYALKTSDFINESHAEDAIIENEETNRIFELLEKRLCPREAEAITLRFGSDCTIEEVARAMNVDGRSVSRYISVGLKKVRKFMTVKRGKL